MSIAPIPGYNGGTGSPFFTLSGPTSARTYTFQDASVTIPSADGTGATGTWNISILGNAATATSSGSSTSATTIAIANEATDTTCFPLFVTASGAQTLGAKSNTGLIYNSNTNSLTATTFVGALSGNATTATTAGGAPPTGSAGGSLTGTYPSPTIANNAITGGMIANGTIDPSTKMSAGILPNANTTATSSNSGNAIVLRNVSGDFTAGTITANLTGTASTATVANTVSSVNEATDTSCFPLFISASGTQSLQPLNNTGFTYNSNTNILGITGLNISGYVGGSTTPFVNFSTALNGAAFIGVGNIGRVIGTDSSGAFIFTRNLTYDGTNYKYLSTAGAGMLSLDTSGGALRYAVSGTAGNNATLVDALSWSNTGVLTFTANFVSTGTGTNQCVIKSTTTGSTNSGDLLLQRGDLANGFNRILLNTGATLKWSIGSRSGSENYLFWDETNTQAQLTITQGAGAASTATFAGSLVTTNDVTINSGNAIINTAGKTLKIKQGSNACSGTGAVMVAGAVTVNTTAVATGDIVLTCRTATGGTPGLSSPVVTIVNATSFTLTSSNALDTSTYSWVIIKAA